MPITFRLDDVCHALGVKPPTVRRWLQFGLIGNTAKGKNRDGWILEFTCHDLAVLALVKPMTGLACPFSAHKIAVRELKEHAGRQSGNDPPSAWWSCVACDHRNRQSCES